MSLFTYVFYWIWIAFLLCIGAAILIPLLVIIAPIYFIGLLAFVLMA